MTTQKFVKAAMFAAAAVFSTVAMADGHGAKPSVGYVTDANGQFVRDANKFCIKTGYWTKELANQECDPDLLPKPPKAATPAPVVSTKTITLSTDALFDFDKSVIKPNGKKALDALVGDAKAVSVTKIVIEGHADAIGSDAYNQKLSERRANAVKAYLTEKGVNPQKMETVGYGESRPVADNKTAAGRAQNRRVNVNITGQK